MPSCLFFFLQGSVVISLLDYKYFRWIAKLFDEIFSTINPALRGRVIFRIFITLTFTFSLWEILMMKRRTVVPFVVVPKGAGLFLCLCVLFFSAFWLLSTFCPSSITVYVYVCTSSFVNSNNNIVDCASNCSCYRSQVRTIERNEREPNRDARVVAPWLLSLFC